MVLIRCIFLINSCHLKSECYGFYDTANVYTGRRELLIKSYMTVSGNYYVYEYDPGSRNDDYIGKLNNNGLRGYTIFNISNFIDGPNKKAEIYVMSYKNGGPYRDLAFNVR